MESALASDKLRRFGDRIQIPAKNPSNLEM